MCCRTGLKRLLQPCSFQSRLQMLGGVDGAALQSSRVRGGTSATALTHQPRASLSAHLHLHTGSLHCASAALPHSPEAISTCSLMVIWRSSKPTVIPLVHLIYPVQAKGQADWETWCVNGCFYQKEVKLSQIGKSPSFHFFSDNEQLEVPASSHFLTTKPYAGTSTASISAALLMLATQSSTAEPKSLYLGGTELKLWEIRRIDPVKNISSGLGIKTSDFSLRSFHWVT